MERVNQGGDGIGSITRDWKKLFVVCLNWKLRPRPIVKVLSPPAKAPLSLSRSIAINALLHKCRPGLIIPSTDYFAWCPDESKCSIDPYFDSSNPSLVYRSTHGWTWRQQHQRWWRNYLDTSPAGTTPGSWYDTTSHQLDTTTPNQLIATDPVSHFSPPHTSERGRNRNLAPLISWVISFPGREGRCQCHATSVAETSAPSPSPSTSPTASRSGRPPRRSCQRSRSHKRPLDHCFKIFFLAAATTNCASRLGQGDLRGAEGRWPQQVQCPGANQRVWVKVRWNIFAKTLNVAKFVNTLVWHSIYVSCTHKCTYKTFSMFRLHTSVCTRLFPGSWWLEHCSSHGMWKL